MGRNTWADKLQALLLSNGTLRNLVLTAVMCSLCRGPALSVSEPGARSPVPSVSGPSTLCVIFSVPGPDTGPGALCVGARHSRPGCLFRGPALSVSGPGLLIRPTCHVCAIRRASSSACAGRVPFFQERTPNLTVWGTNLQKRWLW